jgi:hypothetical protein
LSEEEEEEEKPVPGEPELNYNYFGSDWIYFLIQSCDRTRVPVGNHIFTHFCE